MEHAGGDHLQGQAHEQQQHHDRDRAVDQPSLILRDQSIDPLQQRLGHPPRPSLRRQQRQKHARGLDFLVSGLVDSTALPAPNILKTC